MSRSLTAGSVARGFDRVREEFAAAHRHDPGYSQLCVYREGEIVVDVSTGSAADESPGSGPLMVVRSATKGALALCVGILIDRGLLDVDAPVGEFWPEYATRGKEQTTTAHFLTHTAGVPNFPSDCGVHTPDIGDWARCVAALENAAPLWIPGTAVHYHGLTFGFLVGEVIRRVTGISAGEYFRSHVAEPLGLDFWIGLPMSEEPRVLPYFTYMPSGGPVPSWISQRYRENGIDPTDPLAAEAVSGLEMLGDLHDFVNSREGHAAELGAINGITDARSLASMYANLAETPAESALISAATVAEMTVSRTSGLLPPDSLSFLPGGDVDVGLGFSLGPQIGGWSTPTFGHGGAGGVIAFCDPSRRAAVAYTCTAMWTEYPDPRMAWASVLDEALSG